MPFKIDDRVVYPAFGVGRVVGLVSKSFFEADTQLYYEVLGERSTVWVQVNEGEARGLRRLTRKDELAHYRAILRGRPVALNSDRVQRQLDLRSQLKRGTLQDLCEMVRDLSAHGWHKPLGEADALALRKSQAALSQEWAAADRVTLPEATAAITALLQEARHSD
jgi:RNA polymerase-interacting CarD/CdnL/TRCF family regulator